MRKKWSSYGYALPVGNKKTKNDCVYWVSSVCASITDVNLQQSYECLASS